MRPAVCSVTGRANCMRRGDLLLLFILGAGHDSHLYTILVTYYYFLFIIVLFSVVQRSNSNLRSDRCGKTAPLPPHFKSLDQINNTTGILIPLRSMDDDLFLSYFSSSDLLCLS